MRLEGPGWWADVRDGLTGGDRKALQEVNDAANGLKDGLRVSDDGDPYEVSPDGVSMVKRPALRIVSRDVLTRRRDVVLQRIVTAWSLGGVYDGAVLDGGDDAPLDLVKALEKLADETGTELLSAGPKAAPTTDGSSSGARDESAILPEG
jgi:hypothetical protein